MLRSSRTGRARRMTISIHHTTCYSTLTTSFLPPVDLQKGKRDAQVQFRGRRHKINEHLDKENQYDKDLTAQ
ncbi:hypothetical protein T09_14751 [Trichinella sp. T9]|nr:hypothetical protein T09_14751 [Trichinella sp. T9]